MQLAHSSRTLPPEQAGVPITISTAEMKVSGTTVALLPNTPATGFAAADKEGGERGLRVIPLARALPADSTEAILRVDARTPYRLIGETLFTLGGAGLSTFHFVVIDGGGDGNGAVVRAEGALTVRLPTRTTAGTPSTLSDLTVVARTNGLWLETDAGDLGQGCLGPGSGPTVPSKGGALDYAELGRCVARLNPPAGATFTLLPRAELDFQSVVTLVDTLAAKYPNVQFAIQR